MRKFRTLWWYHSKLFTEIDRNSPRLFYTQAYQMLRLSSSFLKSPHHQLKLYQRVIIWMIFIKFSKLCQIRKNHKNQTLSSFVFKMMISQQLIHNKRCRWIVAVNLVSNLSECIFYVKYLLLWLILMDFIEFHKKRSFWHILWIPEPRNCKLNIQTLKLHFP